MKRSAYIIRVATAAPFAAFILFTSMWLFAKNELTDLSHYICAVLCYTVLPLLAYPIARTVPKLKASGRSAERKLAIAFSVVGYVAAMIFLFFNGAGRMERIINYTYVISGASLAIMSLLGYKASGHACGVAGPVTALACTLGIGWIVGYLALIPVFWASIKMKRHSFAQLCIGSAIPVVTLLALRQII